MLASADPMRVAMELPTLAAASTLSVDVVAVPRRVEPTPRVRREHEEQEPAVAPRRDSASFSKEALALLMAESDGSCD